MKINFATLIAGVMTTTVLLLSGCTTYVADVKKTEGYTKRLAQTSVVWISSEFLGTRITRSHDQSVSASDRAKSNKNIADLLLFLRELKGTAAAALEKNGVKAAPENMLAATYLRIAPVLGETECAPLGCIDSLWLEAVLFDRQEGKTVWTGRFKVGAPFTGTNDATVVQRFVATLVSQLKASDLL